MSTAKVEVVVVGGGPAGVAAALACARAGREVLLLDRARFPRDKACGEGLLPRALRALAALGAPGLDGRVRRLGLPLQRLGLAALVSEVGGPSATAELCGPDGAPEPGLGVTRLALDAALLEAARAEPGVTVLEGVTALAPLGGPAVEGVRTTVGPIAARAVVIADGLRSRLRHALGLDASARGRPRIGLRVHLGVTRLPWGPQVQVLFEPGLEHYLTPVGPEILEVAVLGEPRAFARRGLAAPTLTAHLRAHPLLGRVLERAEPLAPPADPRLWRVLGAGPFPQRARGLVLDGALLAGDAAGYLDPITGEGIGLALESGHLAGVQLARALAAGRADAHALLPYAEAHAQLVHGAERLTRLALVLARFPLLARRAVAALDRYPALFQQLLRLQAGAPLSTVPPRAWAQLVAG